MDDEMKYWEEADKLNKRIYEAMQELKNARPALAGCDEVSVPKFTVYKNCYLFS